MPRDVRRGHRHVPFVGFREIACQAVEIHRELAGGFGVEQLGEPGGDHSCEHVAGAAGGHARIAGRVDEDLFVRRRDQCAVPLQHDVYPMRRGKVAGDFESARLHFVRRHPEQPAHLTRMRRDDDIPSLAPGQPIRIVRKGVEPVRVNHDRHRGAVHQLPDELARALCAAESRADRNDVARPIRKR